MTNMERCLSLTPFSIRVLIRSSTFFLILTPVIGFVCSHNKKRAKQLKKMKERGQLDPEKLDAFSLFLDVVDVTHCLYKDSERILGNTFGICILQVLLINGWRNIYFCCSLLIFASYSYYVQDFEALTPNLLARTIETVEGGGLVVLLLQSLASLTSLCTMVMVWRLILLVMLFANYLFGVTWLVLFISGCAW